MSVKTQMALVAIGVLVFGLISVIVVQTVPRTMYDDAIVVSVAEQLRALGHQAAIDEMGGRTSDESGRTIDTYLAALKDGSVSLKIERQDDAVLATLPEVQRKWTDYRDAITAWRGSHNQAALTAANQAYQEALGPLATASMDEAQSNVVRLAKIPWILSILGALLVGYILTVSRRMTGQLSRTVDSLSSTSAGIAVTLEEQARVASQQAVATNETTATMEELRASANVSAEQAQSAAGQSRQVLQLTQDSNTAMEQTAAGIERLKTRVEAFSQHILKLSEQVSQIGTITAQVGDLANQTNMLALNAAVEAVRAGDQGRGFAVVAAEIRKLADQSRTSAERIGQLVGDIQKATNATVMIAEQGIRNAEDSTQLTHKATESLQVVESSMTSIYDSVQQISLNARQQAEAVRQVLDAVSSLNSGAQETAQGMAQTRAGMHQLDSAAQGLRSLVGLVETRRTA